MDLGEVIPWAVNGWNEIIPNLYQGGQYRAGRTMLDQRVRVTDEFDAVYSLFWENDRNGPDRGIFHEHYQIPDGELTEHQLFQVKVFALGVVDSVDSGLRTLVRCQAGYNRSGLVVAFALMELGYGRQEAIDLIREKRSPWALCNQHFVGYILENA